MPPWPYVLVYDVMLFNIHSPFFSVTITFCLLNWLFTIKGGNRIHDFIIFLTYCNEVRRHISNYICWFTLLFAHFYHILKWSICCSVCSHRSCCSNSQSAQVPQENWACKIIVHDNVIIGGLFASQEVCWLSLQLLVELP